MAINKCQLQWWIYEVRGCSFLPTCYLTKILRYTKGWICFYKNTNMQFLANVIFQYEMLFFNMQAKYCSQLITGYSV